METYAVTINGYADHTGAIEHYLKVAREAQEVGGWFGPFTSFAYKTLRGERWGAMFTLTLPRGEHVQVNGHMHLCR